MEEEFNEGVDVYEQKVFLGDEVKTFFNVKGIVQRSPLVPGFSFKQRGLTHAASAGTATDYPVSPTHQPIHALPAVAAVHPGCLDEFSPVAVHGRTQVAGDRQLH